MAASSTSKEHLTTARHYETVHFTPQTEELVKKFLDEQSSLFGQTVIDSPPFEHLADLRINTGSVLRVIRIYGDPNLSFLTFARENDRIVGFDAVGINEEKKVISGFVGVGYDSVRQGIATELIRHRHARLQSLGITQYTVSVHEGSKAVFEKALGHPMTSDPQDKEGMRHFVTLEQK